MTFLFVSAKLQTKSKNGKIRAKTSRFISGKAESKLEILEIQAASSKSSSIHTKNVRKSNNQIKFI